MFKNIILVIVLIILASSCGAGVKDDDFKDGVLDDEHRIFVSSISFNGNLSGLSGADKKCTDLARSVGLKREYKGILSSDEGEAIDRISINGPTYLFDSDDEKTEIASVTSFWDTDNEDLIDPIKYDEAGNLVNNEDVWTGTTSEGTYSSGFNETCNNWNSSSSGLNGDYGNNSFTNSNWIEITVDSCDEQKRIYCISQ